MHMTRKFFRVPDHINWYAKQDVTLGG